MYASEAALLEKHREMLMAHSDRAVTVRFQIATIDIEQRARSVRVHH
ncbi:hypothetical protein [Mycolicibacter arupensis]|nr:hypothetical protein [Mycolicibacter arupensis]